MKEFGKSFWQLILDNHPTAKELIANNDLGIKSIQYCDRYLKSPLTAGLFALLMDDLRRIVGKTRWGNIYVDFTTMNIKSHEGNFQHNRLWDDWKENGIRAEVMKSIFSFQDMALSVKNKNRNDLPHFRKLSVEFTSNDRLDISLDQGVSCWKTKYIEFDFSLPANQQAEHLNQIMNAPETLIKEGDSNHTIIAVKRVMT